MGKTGQKYLSTPPKGVDKHALYQQTVQYPPGDIHWMNKFYRRYIGPQVPSHLREDFCGTALISATWCKQDVRHTATGIDIDGEVLVWAQQHNLDGCHNRLCLIQANVLQQPSTGTVLQQPAEICQPQETQQQQQVQAAVMQPKQQQIGFDLPSEEQTAAPAGSDQAAAEDYQAELAEAQDAEGYQAVLAAAAVGAAPSNSSRSSSSSSAVTKGRATLLDHRSPSAQAADLDTPVKDSTTIVTVPHIGVFSVDDTEEQEKTRAEDLALKPADIICAFNFSVCLLHKRHEVIQYFKQVRASLNPSPGGVFVLDLMGGRSVEQVVVVKRSNFKTGMRYTFEQERYNPLTRSMRCHITLQDPVSKQVLKRAFTYSWRMWSVGDVLEMLKEAGFVRIAVWVKPIQGSGDSDDKEDISDGDDDDESAGGSDSDSKHAGSDEQVAEGNSSNMTSFSSAGLNPASSNSSKPVDCGRREPGRGGGAAAGPRSPAGDADEDEEPYVEYNPATASLAFLNRLTRGWTAYVVAVVKEEGGLDVESGPGV